MYTKPLDYMHCLSNICGFKMRAFNTPMSQELGLWRDLWKPEIKMAPKGRPK
jgi:hypothetical protein